MERVVRTRAEIDGGTREIGHTIQEVMTFEVLDRVGNETCTRFRCTLEGGSRVIEGTVGQERRADVPEALWTIIKQQWNDPPRQGRVRKIPVDVGEK